MTLPSASHSPKPSSASATTGIWRDRSVASRWSVAFVTSGSAGMGTGYFDGVARIVGNDVYKLDRNGDGFACEPD